MGDALAVGLAFLTKYWEFPAAAFIVLSIIVITTSPAAPESWREVR